MPPKKRAGLADALELGARSSGAREQIVLKAFDLPVSAEAFQLVQCFSDFGRVDIPFFGIKHRFFEDFQRF